MLVDVHGHLAPYGEKGGGPPSLRDPEGAIEAKRALGIAMTIIGSPVGAGSMLPGPAAAANYRQSVDQVRAHNERMGELVSRFPDALRAYAYLDPFGGDAMLAQAAELVRDWRFVGVVVNTSVEGELLGSPRAADFFAMLAETRVPALLHPPAEPVGTASLPAVPLVEHIVRPCDVTMAVASIVAGGWLERYPDVALIAAAGAGAIALLADKLDLALRQVRGRGAPDARPAVSARESLRRFYVETSCPSPAQLAANVTLFGPDRVLFGTDAPPVMEFLPRIVQAVDALPAQVRRRVGGDNARALFGLAPHAAPPVPAPAAGDADTSTAGSSAAPAGAADEPAGHRASLGGTS